MPSISSIEKKRMAQRGEMGSWVTASGYARNANPGPMERRTKRKKKIKGTEHSQHTQHTAHFLSFIFGVTFWVNAISSSFTENTVYIVGGGQ